MADAADDDLVDYDDDDVVDTNAADDKDAKKGHYVGIHASGFRDFILKPECLRAVVDCGFEHPSEVQHECIPQAVLGMDIICQAKSGMGKTAVFVLATLHQLEPVDGEVSVLVLCHTRELAFQIKNEYTRFSKYLPNVKCEVFYGGTIPRARSSGQTARQCDRHEAPSRISQACPSPRTRRRSRPPRRTSSWARPAASSACCAARTSSSRS